MTCTFHEMRNLFKAILHEMQNFYRAILHEMRKFDTRCGALEIFALQRYSTAAGRAFKTDTSQAICLQILLHLFAET